MGTKIEWATDTWNPVVGCSKTSPGCDNCYALSFARRLRGAGVRGYEDAISAHGQWSGKTAFIEHVLDAPHRWRKPRRIFVVSMGDLFHETVKPIWQDRIGLVMAKERRHTFMVLTKRPEAMRLWVGRMFDDGIWPMPNVWMGVTAENQEQAEKRIPVLLKTPAAVRFVSIEPMLGPVNLIQYMLRREQQHWLQWVICGGESGPKARPMAESWAKSLRDQCAINRVPFLFKRWGPKDKGRLLDEGEYDEYPARP